VTKTRVIGGAALAAAATATAMTGSVATRAGVVSLALAASLSIWFTDGVRNANRRPVPALVPSTHLVR
jgi:hypothetical protein